MGYKLKPGSVIALTACALLLAAAAAAPQPQEPALDLSLIHIWRAATT